MLTVLDSTTDLTHNYNTEEDSAVSRYLMVAVQTGSMASRNVCKGNAAKGATAVVVQNETQQT